MSGEIYSYLYEKVINCGALDIYTESIYMKKNRPATKVSILCKEEDLDTFVNLLLIETSTFGVRYQKHNRVILDREFKYIDTEYGKVKVKLGYLNNKLIKVTPEYEDCKSIAIEQGIPLHKFMNIILYTIKEKFYVNLLT